MLKMFSDLFRPLEKGKFLIEVDLPSEPILLMQSESNNYISLKNIKVQDV